MSPSIIFFSFFTILLIPLSHPLERPLAVDQEVTHILLGSLSHLTTISNQRAFLKVLGHNLVPEDTLSQVISTDSIHQTKKMQNGIENKKGLQQDSKILWITLEDCRLKRIPSYFDLRSSKAN